MLMLMWWWCWWWLLPPSSLLIATVDGQPEFTAAVTHRLAKRMDLEVCIGRFDVHKNTIIRTGESQAIGGKYLQGLELETGDECERLCCETQDCDVYIFERKAGGYCYLFECGPPENFHCKFTRHANYTSAVLTPQVQSPSAPQSPPSEPPPVVVVATTTTTVKPTSQPTPTPIRNNISQQEWELTSLKLKPEMRDPKLKSTSALPSNNNNNNMNNINVGQGGAFPQTISHCGRFQFSCHSGDCIAVYNACDGIPQCEDGSDEGPECNVVVVPPPPPPVPLAKSNVEMPKANVNQYQTVQQSSSSIAVLGPPQLPPPPPPPMVNNREDAAAWANRKLIADQLQQQQQQQPQQQGEVASADELSSHIFNHKGGLQVATNTQGQSMAPLMNQQGGLAISQLPQNGYPTATNNNNNNAQMVGGGGVGSGTVYGMSMPHNGNLYMMPPASQSQSQPQNVLLPSQPVQQLSWPSTGSAAGQQQQQQLQQQVVHYAVPQLPQLPNQQQQQQVLLPVLNSKPTHNQISSTDDEYDDYEEEKSTEPPKKKQRKHKKQKVKTKDPIELALEQTKQKSLPIPVPAQVSPEHEQYKMIHENLALEFRDHDGLSERPGGAVLSLTLGVLVTAALAILIGCRMRTVGRRARRLGGKMPYSQEADFLVNGMYL